MMFFNDNAEIVYITKNALGLIADKFSIEDLDSFYLRVNGIAYIYSFTKDIFEDGPSIKDTKKSLEKVRKQAEKLADSIDQLNDFETLWLWMAQRDLKTFPITLVRRMKDFQENVFSKEEVHGIPVYIQGTKEGGCEVRYMEPDDLCEAITAIQKHVEYGVKKLPKGRDGRKKHHGLYMLISNLEIYWTKDLGREFTFDEVGGKGYTEAFEFCNDIALALNPKVTHTQVQTQMRNVIANR